MADLKSAATELQTLLGDVDFSAALRRMRDDPTSAYLLVKRMERLRLKLDGNKNHKRPHLHIDYGRDFHAASFAIDTGERLVGNLNARYDRPVREWILANNPQLMSAWNLLREGKDATAIAVELQQREAPPF